MFELGAKVLVSHLELHARPHPLPLPYPPPTHLHTPGTFELGAKVLVSQLELHKHVCLPKRDCVLFVDLGP